MIYIYTHTYIYTYVYRSIASSTVQLQKWPRPAMLLVAFGNSSASGYAASCACAPVGFGPLSQLQLEQRCETTNSRQVGSPQRNHGETMNLWDFMVFFWDFEWDLNGFFSWNLVICGLGWCFGCFFGEKFDDLESSEPC